MRSRYIQSSEVVDICVAAVEIFEMVDAWVGVITYRECFCFVLFFSTWTELSLDSLCYH